MSKAPSGTKCVLDLPHGLRDWQAAVPGEAHDALKLARWATKTISSDEPEGQPDTLLRREESVLKQLLGS